MSKLLGEWGTVPLQKVLNWLSHPANIIDKNGETALDRCRRIENLNHFVKPLMDNGAISSTAVKSMWNFIRDNYKEKEH
jgi:adenylylsulfate kinase-like enzyme